MMSRRSSLLGSLSPSSGGGNEPGYINIPFSGGYTFDDKQYPIYRGYFEDNIELWNFLSSNAVLTKTSDFSGYGNVPQEILQDTPIYINGMLITEASAEYGLGESDIRPYSLDLHTTYTVPTFTIYPEEVFYSLSLEQNIEVPVENGYGEFTYDQILFICSYMEQFGESGSTIPDNFKLTFNGMSVIFLTGSTIDGSKIIQGQFENGEFRIEGFDYTYIIIY